MVITILGMVADMELSSSKTGNERASTRQKLTASTRAGKKNVDDAEIRRRITAGATKAAVARDLNISRMTVYRALEGQGSQSAFT
jgi:DNA invertase Pin-like site-specific DNA recombinase